MCSARNLGSAEFSRNSRACAPPPPSFFPPVQPAHDMGVAVALGAGKRIVSNARCAVWVCTVLDQNHDRMQLPVLRREGDRRVPAAQRLPHVGVARAAGDVAARRAREGVDDVGAAPHGEAVQGAQDHVGEA
eukprot:CAMPEP_0171731398 /NCGR_PEP_ID=MMETSP0991-20121206/28918_1 /TAXON_ID=483369 /ORGANISM="non described non described, Strain CCMP2098" /LENGTH=131 /DNA_ID=CAMNT_0012326425 /DNA_START=328 /DNA_END=723 /DNA_ORIENTATION=+